MTSTSASFASWSSSWSCSVELSLSLGPRLVTRLQSCEWPGMFFTSLGGASTQWHSWGWFMATVPEGPSARASSFLWASQIEASSFICELTTLHRTDYTDSEEPTVSFWKGRRLMISMSSSPQALCSGLSPKAGPSVSLGPGRGSRPAVGSSGPVPWLCSGGPWASLPSSYGASPGWRCPRRVPGVGSQVEGSSSASGVLVASTSCRECPLGSTASSCGSCSSPCSSSGLMVLAGIQGTRGWGRLAHHALSTEHNAVPFAWALVLVHLAALQLNARKQAQPCQYLAEPSRRLGFSKSSGMRAGAGAGSGTRAASGSRWGLGSGTWGAVSPGTSSSPDMCTKWVGPQPHFLEQFPISDHYCGNNWHKCRAEGLCRGVTTLHPEGISKDADDVHLSFFRLLVFLVVLFCGTLAVTGSEASHEAPVL
nr:uncharacterized protein LOC127493729 [Oryctolagus cuniculus]